MIIKDMFSKPIDRDIKGVIKVGQADDENIKQELEEYVVTRELQKHFTDFFGSYKKGINGHTDKMGVWISGFFGSGKSHFLKILSYLLANKEVNGKNALDYFVEDNKITDAMVLADIRLAASIAPNTDVVLFNIVKQHMQERTSLLEMVAEKICYTIKDRFPVITEIKIDIYKCSPPIENFQGKTGITMQKTY